MKCAAGFGCNHYRLAFCINNRPQLDDYADFVGVRGLAPGELDYIVRRTSNHWRKLFNVYAKFLFELGWAERFNLPVETWQALRDDFLLQGITEEALLFSQPILKPPKNTKLIHIIAGKTYGLSLLASKSLQELESGIYYIPELFTVITPYMDYRQLTNQKISSTVRLVKPWLNN